METFDLSFNTWMQPAGVVTSAEVVAARRSVAIALPSTVDDYSLALAAFGELDDDVKSAIEAKLQEHDPTHVPGKKNLVELLCAAAVLSAFERNDDQAVDLALLAQSALFRGLKPRIKWLGESSASVLAAAAGRSRQRLVAKKPNGRNQSAASGEAADSAAVQAVAARVEQLVAHFDAQLGLLNEEVDVLWWARSGRDARGREWGALPELERATAATAEISEFVVDLPITGAVFEVLRDIADGPKRKTATIEEIGSTASGHAQFPDLEQSRWLLPLLSATRIARMYPEEARAGVVSAELGLDAGSAFKIVDLPEQLLREMAILKRVL